MSTKPVTTPAPTSNAAIEIEQMELELSAKCLDAFNFVFAYRNAAMIAVKGSAKLETLREHYAGEFFKDAVKREALNIARRLYAKANNVGPTDLKNITDNQLWSFIAGL